MSETIPEYAELQPRLVAKVKAAYEDAGEAWLHQLPAILTEIAGRWSLTLLPPFSNLSFNYVAPVVLPGGSHAVLKAGVPHPERASEILALEAYDGDGMPRLLRSDIHAGVALIEQVFPGNVLTDLGDDDEATRIAARIVRRGWREPGSDHRFIPVSDWFAGLADLRRRFDGGPGPFSEFTVNQAERLFADLTASTEKPMLIHGDFHHYNILRNGDAWIAIDPKGVVGDPSFDFAMFLMNPLDFRNWPNWEARLARRIDIFEEEGFDRARIVGWLRAFSVLSNWWSIVGDDPTLPERVAFVERIARMEL